jgi:hypothetical protein
MPITRMFEGLMPPESITELLAKSLAELSDIREHKDAVGDLDVEIKIRSGAFQGRQSPCVMAGDVLAKMSPTVIQRSDEPSESKRRKLSA